MTAEGAFLKLVKEFLPFSLRFLPKNATFLRLAEVLDDVADGLGREELKSLVLQNKSRLSRDKRLLFSIKRQLFVSTNFISYFQILSIVFSVVVGKWR